MLFMTMKHFFISKQQKRLLPGRRIIEQTNLVVVNTIISGLAKK
jgi:hypothetical protein